MKKIAKLIAVGLVLVTGVSYAALYPTPLANDANTLFLYQFNETSGTTAADTSSYGRNATYGSGVTLGQPTVFETGKSILSQENTVLTSATYWQATGLGTSSILSTAIYQNDFTVEMWVNWKFDAPPDQSKTLFAIQPIGSTAVDLEFNLLNSNNPWHKNGLKIQDSTGVNKWVDGGTAWQVDTWYHVAMVVDYQGVDTNYKIYWTEEGVTTPNLVMDKLAAGVVLAGGAADRQLIIGQMYGDSGKRFWSGDIDAFKFSNKALTSNELEASLQMIPEPASALLLVSGLIAAWKLRRRG